MDGVEGWLEAESLALAFEGFQKGLNPGGGKDIENLLDLGGIGGDLPGRFNHPLVRIWLPGQHDGAVGLFEGESVNLPGLEPDQPPVPEGEGGLLDKG